MAFADPVMLYCERVGAGFWAEPANAWSNAGFLAAAAMAFRDWRESPRRDWPALALIFVLVATGIGSFLFHTLATRGAELLDVIPIALFIHVYFFLAMRRFLGLHRLTSLGLTLAFLAAGLVVGRLGQGALNGSIAYVPALLALIVVALLAGGRRMLPAAQGPAVVPDGAKRRAGIRHQIPECASRLRDDKAQGSDRLALAAVIFPLSLAARTLDRTLCSIFPIGTHFVWHLLNALVLYLLVAAALRARAAIA